MPDLFQVYELFMLVDLMCHLSDSLDLSCYVSVFEGTTFTASRKSQTTRTTTRGLIQLAQPASQQVLPVDQETLHAMRGFLLRRVLA